MSTAFGAARDYEFEGGFPTPETSRRAFDDADLVRAITAYRFFYPSVSAVCVYDGNIDSGMVANRRFCVVRDAVGMSGFTMNSDTPYVGLSLDVSAGPIVIELPPGALMGAVNDLHQRWVMDIGLPGPDHGQGGKHLLLPPGHTGEVPARLLRGDADNQPGARVDPRVTAAWRSGCRDRADEVRSGSTRWMARATARTWSGASCRCRLTTHPGRSRPRCAIGRCSTT